MTSTPGPRIHHPGEHQRFVDDGVPYCGHSGDGGIYHGCGAFWTPGHDVAARAAESASGVGDLDTNLLAISEWIDNSPRNANRDPEALLWSRVTKVCEESGEVWRALSLYVGENPRKGHDGTQQAIEDELLDTAAAALAAVHHLNGNDPRTSPLGLLSARVEATARRAGVAS
jgi:hypothetical protein